MSGPEWHGGAVAMHWIVVMGEEATGMARAKLGIEPQGCSTVPRCEDEQRECNEEPVGKKKCFYTGRTVTVYSLL